VSYLKVNFSPSELKVFRLKEKTMGKFFAENGFQLNETELFRTFVLNFDNDELMGVLLKLYKEDVSPLFHMVPQK